MIGSTHCPSHVIHVGYNKYPYDHELTINQDMSLFLSSHNTNIYKLLYTYLTYRFVLLIMSLTYNITVRNSVPTLNITLTQVKR